jgi:hypothetical protein
MATHKTSKKNSALKPSSRARGTKPNQTPGYILTPDQLKAIKHPEILDTWPLEKKKLYRDALALNIAMLGAEINRLKAKRNYRKRKLAAEAA